MHRRRGWKYAEEKEGADGAAAEEEHAKELRRKGQAHAAPCSGDCQWGPRCDGQLLQSMIKQRRDSIDAYNKGGRKELAEGEAEEIEIITKFLPEQMSDVAVENAVCEIISLSEASSIKDMGKIMGQLKQKYPDSIDFSKVNIIVKSLLS